MVLGRGDDRRVGFAFEGAEPSVVLNDSRYLQSGDEGLPQDYVRSFQSGKGAGNIKCRISNCEFRSGLSPGKISRRGETLLAMTMLHDFVLSIPMLFIGREILQEPTQEFSSRGNAPRNDSIPLIVISTEGRNLTEADAFLPTQRLSPSIPGSLTRPIGSSFPVSTS